MLEHPQLCDACVAAFGRLQKLETPVEHHVSLDGLQAAASFCAFCKRIMPLRKEDLEGVNLKTALCLHHDEKYGSDIQVLRARPYQENLEDVLVGKGSPQSLYGNFMLKRVAEASGTSSCQH